MTIVSIQSFRKVFHMELGHMKMCIVFGFVFFFMHQMSAHIMCIIETGNRIGNVVAIISTLVYRKPDS